MHSNRAFRRDDTSHAVDLAQDRGFGVVTVNGPEGPFGAHVPFVVEEGAILCHLTRANPIARMIQRQGPQAALLIVSGPDAYISPDWYETDDQVPTWNYVAAHIRGQIDLLPENRLYAHLEALSAVMEARLAPKKPWTMDKMSPGTVDAMMRAILPAVITVEGTQSTWKLNQNKTAAARLAAAEKLEGSPIGHDISGLVHLMRGVEQD
ncbi:MAG: FMN-binding negative transcriptional regulator [Pseudomonadota bacterium]